MRSESRALRMACLCLCVTLVVQGCATPDQMQKTYGSFDACFRKEKQTAMLLGALPGTVIGIGAATRKSAGGVAAGAAIAVIGAIIGNRVAWENCLQAFPVRGDTLVIADRMSSLRGSGPGEAEEGRSLAIQDVSAQALIFGKDVQVTATYRYIGDDPAGRDIKATVSRNLLFTAPDGSRHEVPSSTDDTIQQGVSRSSFSIPTPSLSDAPELKSTKDWAFKLVVEVDGLREERVVPLNVPELGISVTPSPQVPATRSPSPGTPRATPPATPPVAAPAPSAGAAETITLKQGTRLYQEPNTRVVITPMPATQSVTVLKRITQGGYHWALVRLQNGTEGWFRSPVR